MSEVEEVGKVEETVEVGEVKKTRRRRTKEERDFEDKLKAKDREIREIKKTASDSEKALKASHRDEIKKIKKAYSDKEKALNEKAKSLREKERELKKLEGNRKEHVKDKEQVKEKELVAEKVVDRDVRREFIPLAKEGKNSKLWAYDAHTNEPVHISEAFNGISHDYYVKSDTGEKVKVVAYQGEQLGWHFGAFEPGDKHDFTKCNNGIKHDRTVQTIVKLGCLRVKPLTFASDAAMNWDFTGFDRPIYTNCHLYEECTVVADKVRSELAMTLQDFPFPENYKPDIIFDIGDKIYAIEVIDKHPLFPKIQNTDKDLAKMKYYFDNNIDVIAVNITHLSMEDIESGNFYGEWYLSSYARQCMEILYSMCKHSYVKNDLGNNVQNFNAGTIVCNCYGAKSTNVSTEHCRNCQNSSQNVLYAFRDKDRKLGDEKDYFYQYKGDKYNTGNLCVHCFKFDAFNKFRTRDKWTLPNFLQLFKTTFGHRADLFNERFKAYKEGNPS